MQVERPALGQSGRMPPKRECQTESPLCTGDALSAHLHTESPPTSLAAAKSGPLLSHTTHLPWNQQERMTPQSMALSLVLAGKSYQVWKPGVLLRGGKKRNVSATRKKHHMRTQSRHSVGYPHGKVWRDGQHTNGINNGAAETLI